MNPTASPSLTSEPDGTFRVAIQTSTGDLEIYNPTTSTGSDTGQAMKSGTSASITD